MEQFRSKSYNGGEETRSPGTPPSNMQDLRCYSATTTTTTTSYANCVVQQQKEMKIKMKKIKSKSKSSIGSSSSKSWSSTNFTDPEIQRKKRVASYKVYAVEGKMKGSLKKSFRWIKDTYTQVVYGHG